MDFAEYTLKNYEADDYKKLFAYSDTSEENKQIFKPDHTLIQIAFDSKNKLFSLSSSGLTYSFGILKEAEFSFVQKDKTTLDYVLRLKSENPKFDIELTLARDIHIEELRDEEVGNDFLNHLPRPVYDFTLAFQKTYMDVSMEKFEKRMTEKHKVPITITRESLKEDLEYTAKEIVNALRVYDIDSLEGVTVRDLAKIKYKLLSPGVISPAWANEVNKSYKILKELITEADKQNLNRS